MNTELGSVAGRGSWFCVGTASSCLCQMGEESKQLFVRMINHLCRQIIVSGWQVWRCVGGLLQAASSTTLRNATATTPEAARACTILGSGAEQCGEPEAARALLQLSGTTCG